METSTTRSPWDFMYEILAFLGLNPGVVRTRIENHIGLSARYAKKYFKLLQDREYITMTEEDHGKRKIYICNVTDNGLELRDAIKSIYDLFGGKHPKW